MIKPEHKAASSQMDILALPMAAKVTGGATPNTQSILDRIASQEARAMAQDHKIDKILAELQKASSANAGTQLAAGEPYGQGSKVDRRKPPKASKEPPLIINRGASQQQKPRQQQRQPHQEQQQEQWHANQEQQQVQQSQQPQHPTWSQVVGRGRKKINDRPSSLPGAKPSMADKVNLLRRRAPKSAAVTIDGPTDGGSLAAIMKKVSGAINLSSLGINVLTSRKTRTGGILLEVDGAEKATLLVEKIREVIRDAARVRLPESRTPALLLGIPEWAETKDVAAGLDQVGITGIEADEVTIRKNTGGRGEYVASLNLTLQDAIELAERKAVIVGWTRCRTKLLEKSQPICYRCQGRGHLAGECSNEAKPRCCFRCKKRRPFGQGLHATTTVRAAGADTTTDSAAALSTPPWR